MSDNALPQLADTTTVLQDPPRVPIVRYDEYFNQRTFQKALRKTTKPKSEERIGKKRPVFVVRRKINSRGQYEKTEIDIKSPRMLEIFLDMQKDVQGLELSRAYPTIDTNTLFFSEQPLRQRLAQELAAKTRDVDLIEELNITLQLLAEEVGETAAEFHGLAERGVISHKMLWALYPPNTHIYHRDPITDQDCVMIARFSFYERTNKGYFFVLNCDIIGDDGDTFGLIQRELRILQFAGAQRIRDLLFYPFTFHTDADRIRRHAIARGKRFATITRQSFEVSGSFGIEKVVNYEPIITANKCYGRVIIDPAALRTFEPDSVLCVWRAHSYRDRETLDDDEYLIFSPNIGGFSFALKKWGLFAADRLQEIAWSDEAFEQLVLPDKLKQHIHSIVKQHSSHEATFDDVVANKGKGLIGLLCGNPGCGKTLTAEAVAEVTRRPLWVLSAGSLGDRPETVEAAFTRALELSQQWGALLLLDEADVFMQKRSTTDITRNALVSIFLRELEYYKGILILTTNFAANIDPAFESRIHFCVKYPDLGYSSRRTIWKIFLTKALRGLDSISNSDLDRLAQHTLNGRQIKNAVGSAQALARAEATPLQPRHIDMVLEVFSDWNVATIRDGASHQVQLSKRHYDFLLQFMACLVAVMLGMFAMLML